MIDDDWFSEETATFGDRLAGAREAAGLTQAALATKLGVKLTTLAGWENDLREPRANRLQMVAGLLGVSLTWLLTGQGDGPDAPDAADAIPPEQLDLLAEMRLLRVQARQMAERIGQLEKRLRASLKDTL